MQTAMNKISILLFLLIISCAFQNCKEKVIGVTRIYEGRYTFGFEGSNFNPCEYEGVWWVRGDLSKVWEFVEGKKEYESTWRPEREEGTVFIRCRANLSPKGKYGHLGAYEYQLNVEEILSVRKIADGDCKK